MGPHRSRLGWVCALVAVLRCRITALPHRAADEAARRPARPRICLVLSGGGARGIAHVGVLKVLEDLQIPIDCIAGTSMGAVVGGLYASGMSAHEIDTTIRSLDWQEAFRDSPPRRELGFRRKQDDRNFLVRLPLGIEALAHSPAQGVGARPEAPGDAAPADRALRRPHRFRPAADAVSRRGHRSRDRRGRTAGRRRPGPGDAGQHFRSGRVRTGRVPGPAAGGRRTGGESADRRREGSARRRPDRLRRELSAPGQGQARFGVLDLQPNAGHSRAPRFRPPAPDADRAGRAHRARAGRCDLHRFHRRPQYHRAGGAGGAGHGSRARASAGGRRHVPRLRRAARGARARAADHSIRAGGRAVETLREDHPDGDAAPGGPVRSTGIR